MTSWGCRPNASLVVQPDGKSDILWNLRQQNENVHRYDVSALCVKALLQTKVVLALVLTSQALCRPTLEPKLQ